MVNAFEAAIAAFASWNSNRQAYVALPNLSDDLLLDVGLSRVSLRNTSF